MNRRFLAAQNENEEVTMETIVADYNRCLQWCFDNLLLRYQPNCPLCGARTYLALETLRIDLHRWVCTRRSKFFILRFHSFFENSFKRVQWKALNQKCIIF